MACTNEEVLKFAEDLKEKINDTIDSEAQTVVGGSKCMAYYNVIQIINQMIEGGNY